ncbi:MAG: hypothetical protein C4325_00665 [Blastocatellia bacterium]
MNRKFCSAFSFLLVILAFSGIGLGQTKTVTNADLEKFRQRRLDAEKDLQEFYRRLGLSPEEIAKREAAEAKEREDLSFKLRQLRLEREQAEAKVERLYLPQVNVFLPQSRGIDYAAFFLYGNRLYTNPPVWYRPYDDGVQYRVTPFGIIYEPGGYSSNVWPPPRPYPQPPMRPTPR